MKKVQRINESQLRTIVTESVKKVQNENLSYTSAELPNILREMASYLENDCYKEEYEDYWNEIIQSGLFHDACGKSEECRSAALRVKIDY